LNSLPKSPAASKISRDLDALPEAKLRSKKYAGHIFRAESGAMSRAPRKKACKGKSPADAGVEDLNGKESAVAERTLFEPQTVLLRWERPPRAELILAMARHLVKEWF
jgi:hypothetical protein